MLGSSCSLDSLITILQPFSKIFTQNGKKLYLVGGAVRDHLLGKPSQDYDFATDATPQQVRQFFSKVIPTGLSHGTVTVLFQGRSFEVTTFRIDGKYSKHRRPDNIKFTSLLKEDLKRRDFTINALAIDLEAETLIDDHEGIKDLKSGLLKAIGNPFLRFEEDALRILRLFRLASQLNFSIEEQTYQAAQSTISLLKMLSRERIHEEIVKTLASPFPEKGFFPFQQLGILKLLFPDKTLSTCRYQDMALVRELPLDLRLPTLLLGWTPTEKAISWKEPLHHLTFSNQEIRTTLLYYQVLQNLTSLQPSVDEVKKIFNLMQDRHNTLLPQALITLSCGSYNMDEKTALAWSQLWQQVAHSDDPIFLKELAIKGTDLLQQGWKANQAITKTLEQLQRFVWKDRSLNQRDKLLQLAHNIKNHLIS